MALPTSGPLSISTISDTVSPGANDFSLASLSQTAGFTPPYNIAAFYGYSPTVDVFFRFIRRGVFAVELLDYGLPNGFSEFTCLTIGFTYRVYDDGEGYEYNKTREETFCFNTNFDSMITTIESYPIYIMSMVSINYWYISFGGTSLNVTGVYK